MNQNFAGQYESAFKGRGIEFAEIRQYQPGDDIRTIDWNVTARAGQPYVKTFIEERELTVLLLVDGSASSFFGCSQKTKQQLTAEFCAVLALTASRQQDKVGCMIFSEDIERYLTPSKGRGHCLQIISQLLSYQPEAKRTNLNLALETVTKILKKRAIVFVVSDFLDSGYEQSLKILAQRHEVVAVSVTDEREESIPNIGLVELQDYETDEIVTIDTSSKSARDLYAKRAAQRKRELQRSFRKMGIDLLPIHTHRPFIIPLAHFLQNRQRRR
ncbi:MAG: DUF58 domain-containing protein [Planctomycetota bacterium]|nr:DUF58 domain-containing protein [Planctomycetota bacterium]